MAEMNWVENTCAESSSDSFEPWVRKVVGVRRGDRGWGGIRVEDRAAGGRSLRSRFRAFFRDRLESDEPRDLCRATAGDAGSLPSPAPASSESRSST